MKKLFSLLLNVMLIATLPTMCLQANPPANDPPVITVSGNTSVCYGSSTTLTASGAQTYLWTSALPLDGISSAYIAVGLHKLKTSYAGFALQLRRQSDNAVMDFGFSGNDLDLAAISTFLNGSNGFCSILYDQSGNGNNLTQPNAANQPLFVANGQNGKPVLRCTTSHFMKNPTNFNGQYSVVYAAKQTGPNRQRVLSSVANNWLLGWWSGGKDQAYFEGWLTANPGIPAADNNAVLYSATGNGTSSSVYKNGAALYLNNTGGTAGPNGIRMNGSDIFGEPSECDFMDIMVFNVVLPGSDRVMVENSVAAYYNIGNGGSQLTVSPLTTTTYTVTGTAANGESSSTTVTVNVGPQHTTTPSGAVIICAGSSVTLNASAGSAYLWSTGETTQSITVDTAGIFTVEVDNCPVADFIQTYVASVTPTVASLCSGQAVLHATGPTALTPFAWTGPADFDNLSINIPLGSSVNTFTIGSTAARGHSHGGSVNLKIDLFNPSTSQWINIYDANTTTQINFSGLSLTFPTISSVSQVRFYSNPAQGQTFHDFYNAPMSYTTGSTTFPYLWNTGSTNQTIVVNSAGTYSVAIGGCPPVSATVTAIPGNPSVFGNNLWNVYAWNAGGAADTVNAWNLNYAGIYTFDSLGFNTLSSWPSLGAPSDAPGYTGCTVGIENHSWSAKRQGFPCSYYQVNIPSHDDAAQLFIDGVKVWQDLGCCDVHENVWRGYLNSTSQVEFRVTEGGGGSLGSISFIPIVELNCAVNNNITVNIPAGQCSATVNLTPPTATDVCSPITITSDHPSTTFTAGTTYVTWTGTDGNGHSGTCITVVTILEPVAPVINCPASVTVNNSPGICGAIVNIAPTATDNCPTTAIGTNEFNYTGGIQIFPVPAGVSSIGITAIGAAGGSAFNSIPGKGTSMSGIFSVAPGDTLYILVGQKGTNSPNGAFSGGGGGGGTFVTKDKLLINGLLLAAGGGGGAGSGGSSNANITTNGSASGAGIYYGSAAGGTNGAGGGSWTGGGGAGWLTDGEYYECYNGGLMPRNGGFGGGDCGGLNGGYGGGGGSYYGAGGGGGYSGGAGGDYSNDYNFGTYGGGGGSFNSGTNQANVAAVGTGDGKVILHYTTTFPSITLTSGIPPGNVFPVGTTLNTWTVTDASGNTAICSASISVLDKQAPTLTCPANITVNVAPGQCTSLVNYNTPVASDNCCPTLTGNANYSYLGEFNSHKYYLSNSYTDWNTARIAAVAAGGNLASVNSAGENAFLATALGSLSPWIGGFQNHLNPNFSEPSGGWEWTDGSAFTYTSWAPGEPNNSGIEDHLQFYSGGTWNDLPSSAYNQYVVELSCGIQLALLSGPASGSAFPIGTTTITWKATDVAGNTSTCSIDVTVTDNDNPGITVAPITGNGNICTGTPSQLADATLGGTWSSSNTSIATVDNTGLVSGVASGAAIIKYTVNINGCDRVVYKPVTIYAVPVLTGAVITGITNVCPYVGTGIPLTYSITNALSATTYTWTVPPTVTILSGQGTPAITVTINLGFVANANKQIRVKGNSQCGSSADKIFYLLAQFPNTPQPITGQTNICSVLGTSTTVDYKIPIVPGAISYIWNTQAGTTTVAHPNGPGAFDTIIRVTFAAGFTTSNISVQTVNDCGTSSLRSLTVTRISASTPGLINGPTNACPHILPAGSIATYFITPVPGATSYTWTTPVGSVVTHPHTAAYDTIITVKFPNGFTNGNITVTATNGCGTSAARNLAISKLTPATPSVMDIIQTVFCPNRVYTYTLAGMPANATSVLWTVPANAIGFTGQGTTSISVSYPDVAVQGAVTATAINNCGTSTIRSTQVKLPGCPPPGFARTATGNNNKTADALKTLIDETGTGITITPNPSASSFKLTFKPVYKLTAQVRLLDLSGRQLKNFNVKPNQIIEFGNDLKAGVYLVEIQQGDERRTERIIKL